MSNVEYWFPISCCGTVLEDEDGKISFLDGHRLYTRVEEEITVKVRSLFQKWAKLLGEYRALEEQGEPTSVELDEDEDDYEDWLRDLYGDVEVCGSTMDAARVFREMDETGFRVGYAEWSSDRCEDKLPAAVADYEERLEDAKDEVIAVQEELQGIAQGLWPDFEFDEYVDEWVY